MIQYGDNNERAVLAAAETLGPGASFRPLDLVAATGLKPSQLADVVARLWLDGRLLRDRDGTYRIDPDWKPPALGGGLGRPHDGRAQRGRLIYRQHTNRS